jgi:uncharacterized protein
VSCRTFLLAMAVAVAGLAGVSQAQEPDPARVSAAKQMMELAGAAKQFDQVMPLMADQLTRSFIVMAPGKAREIRDVFDQLIPKFIARKGELLDQIASLYATELTQSELDAIIAFYRSPVGAKFASVQPGIVRQSMLLGQRWGQRIGAEFGEAARRELRKRGIDL